MYRDLLRPNCHRQTRCIALSATYTRAAVDSCRGAVGFAVSRSALFNVKHTARRPMCRRTAQMKTSESAAGVGGVKTTTASQAALELQHHPSHTYQGVAPAQDSVIVVNPGAACPFTRRAFGSSLVHWLNIIIPGDSNRRFHATQRGSSSILRAGAPPFAGLPTSLEATLMRSAATWPTCSSTRGRVWASRSAATTLAAAAGAPSMCPTSAMGPTLRGALCGFALLLFTLTCCSCLSCCLLC